MSTIYDVAQLAGVSAKTVSRVLNDDGPVKGPTRERVLDAMHKLDFKPNTQARQLRLGPAKTSVGMLLENTAAGGYQDRMHSAMLAACMETANYLVVELFERGRPDYFGFEHFIVSANVKSLLLLPPLCDYVPLKELLKASGVQVVLISPLQPDNLYPSVNMDDRQAAFDATEHLLKLGHRRIAHIAGDPDHAASGLRRDGFCAALAAAGQPPPADGIVDGWFDFKSGIAATEQLLSHPDRPTAIFAANDEMAAAACTVAHKMGLRIPHDLSVIGFDDAPIASAIWPALTTVRQPYLEMARRALHILNGYEPPNNQRHILAHELVVRDSTAPVAR
jgi:LacI family transcriptional regulator